MKKLIFIGSFACLAVYMQGQTSGAFMESNLVLVSEDKAGQAIKCSVERAYMTLNSSSGDFSLNADLSELKTGDRTKDSLLKSGGEQLLLFKGNIGESLLIFNQQQNDEKVYSMPGTLSLNGSDIQGVAKFDPVNLAEKSEAKNYRMDFILSIPSSKINIKGLENTFNKQVVFEIVAGKLNVQQ